MALAHLALKTDSSQQTFTFSGDTVIGRGAGADIPIPDPTVSRRHASVRLEGRTVVVEDLGSQNGTTLNGESVRIPCRAEDGDTICVGAVALELQIDPEARTDAEQTATPTEVISADELRDVRGA